MTIYEALQQSAHDAGAKVVEDDALPDGTDGLVVCHGRRKTIIVRKGLSAAARKCILAHEIAHLSTGTGDMRAMSALAIVKQEQRAIALTIGSLLPAKRLASVLNVCNGNPQIAAEELGVTEDLVECAIKYYRRKGVWGIG
ncbi:MAG: ImmA/IrrE family metallo-endopeptidase [Christensenellaceae bacterium]|jgi:Zn-dependent peptidase ImmA (M78 family)|nr:ImmA/IrrE family metallo-endopeptidase [Christensenellaceae bacterium]